MSFGREKERRNHTLQAVLICVTNAFCKGLAKYNHEQNWIQSRNNYVTALCIWLPSCSVQVPLFSLYVWISLCDDGILSLSFRRGWGKALSDLITAIKEIGESACCLGAQNLLLPSCVATGHAMAKANQGWQALSITQFCASMSRAGKLSEQVNPFTCIYLPTKTTEISFPYDLFFSNSKWGSL